MVFLSDFLKKWHWDNAAYTNACPTSPEKLQMPQANSYTSDKDINVSDIFEFLQV